METVKPEERRFPDTSSVVLNRRMESGIQSSEGEAGLVGTTGWRYPHGVRGWIQPESSLKGTKVL